MTLTTPQKQKIREGKTCSCCGLDNHLSQSLYGRPLEIHHIQPRREGGTDELNNLTCLCAPCHRAWHQWGEGQISWKQYLKGDWQNGIRHLYWKLADSGMPLERKIKRMQKLATALSLIAIKGG